MAPDAPLNKVSLTYVLYYYDKLHTPRSGIDSGWVQGLQGGGNGGGLVRVSVIVYHLVNGLVVPLYYLHKGMG